MEIKKIKSDQNNYVVIIGAMKAGTTFLYDLLAQHPEICPGYIKEPSFFTKRDWKEEENNLLNYNEFWPEFDSRKHTYKLEGSVNYSKIPEFENAAKRMSLMDGAYFKFIYVLRNPLERIRSHMAFMEIYYRKKGIPYDFKKTGITPDIISITKYAYQLDKYVEHFPRSSIKLISFEEFIRNKQNVLQEIFQFLGLRPFHVDLEANRNSTDDISLHKILYDIRRLIPLQTSLFNMIPSFIKKIFRDHEVSNFELSNKQTEFIRNELREDLIRLEEKYCFDTEQWEM